MCLQSRRSRSMKGCLIGEDSLCLTPPSSPFLSATRPDSIKPPHDDFSLLLSTFEGSCPISILNKDSEGDRAEDLSEADITVPDMPPLPLHLGLKEDFSQEDLQCPSLDADSMKRKTGSSAHFDSGGSLTSAYSVEQLVPVDKASPVKALGGPPKRRGRSNKRRKNAEERAAQIRARNRRAQQAFRKRQKVLTAERSVSLAQLENDVTTLRDTNLRLEQRIEELQAELDGARRSYSKANQQTLPIMSQPLVQPYNFNFFETDNDNLDFLLPGSFI